MGTTVSTTEFEPYMGEPDVNRLIAAMKREKVDRVPNWEALIEDRIVEKILGKFAGNTLAFGGNPAKGVTDMLKPMDPEAHVELCRIIGQDVMIIGTSIWPPFKKEDEHGRLVPVADKSIKTLEDFRNLKPPGPEDIDKVLEDIRSYKEAVKGTNIGVTVQIGGIFIYCYEFLMGFNDFMVACIDDRPMVEEILEITTQWCERLSKAVTAEGIDYSYFYDDGGYKSGLFINPKLMKEIWCPRMARIVKTGVDADNAVFFHSCGNITEIVEDLIDMGVDCINPMAPPGIDYRDWKKRFGDRVCLSGNMDIEWPLVNGTPDDVEKDVIEHMDVLKPGYGYVAASSHSIVNYMPYENFVTLINAIHKYGKY